MADLPFWPQVGMAEAQQAPPSFPPLGGVMPGRDQYDPADLAALRLQRGVRSPARSRAGADARRCASYGGDAV
jgi:hypothetical protein